MERDSNGRFLKGNKGVWLGKKRPNLWNGKRKDLEGKRLSPTTEIKKGQHLSKETEFKCFKFRKGNYKTKMINGKRYPVHHLVWLKANQLHRIPDACIIHHLDGDVCNNSVENLQLLPIDTHRNFHIQSARIMNK
jgi:hypothetical protein